MSKRCDLTGTGAQTGHKVSHSNHKAKRRFLPNLQNISFLSNILGQKVSLRVTPATVRTVDHNGGLDNFLLNTSNLKLTEIAKKLKRRIKKSAAHATAEAEKPAKKATTKKPAAKKRPTKKTSAEKAAKKSPVKKKATAAKKTTKKVVTKKTAEKKKPAAKKKAATTAKKKPTAKK